MISGGAIRPEGQFLKKRWCFSRSPSGKNSQNQAPIFPENPNFEKRRLATESELSSTKSAFRNSLLPSDRGQNISVLQMATSG